MTTEHTIPPAKDGATTALHRRIEELAAELQKEKDRRVEVRRSNQDLNEVVHALTKDLATERAAREQAESALKQADELAREVATANAREAATSRELLQQAERDAALARVMEVEDRLTAAELSEKRLEAGKEVLLSQWETADSLRRAAETALASALSLLSTAALKVEWQGWHDDYQALLTSHPAPVAFLPPVSESDEAIVGALIDARTPAPKPMVAPVADETEMLAEALRYSCADSTKAIDELKQKLARANCLLLCAHPIVARSRDQGLRRAIAYHLRDRDVGFEDTEPETHPATVAAPCAGCAALNAAIDQAIRDMLSGGHPFEKGVAKAINDLRAAQKEALR